MTTRSKTLVLLFILGGLVLAKDPDPIADALAAAEGARKQAQAADARAQADREAVDKALDDLAKARGEEQRRPSREATERVEQAVAAVQGAREQALSSGLAAQLAWEAAGAAADQSDRTIDGEVRRRSDRFTDLAEKQGAGDIAEKTRAAAAAEQALAEAEVAQRKAQDHQDWWDALDRQHDIEAGVRQKVEEYQRRKEFGQDFANWLGGAGQAMRAASWTKTILEFVPSDLLKRVGEKIPDIQRGDPTRATRLGAALLKASIKALFPNVDEATLDRIAKGKNLSPRDAAIYEIAQQAADAARAALEVDRVEERIGGADKVADRATAEEATARASEETRAKRKTAEDLRQERDRAIREGKALDAETEKARQDLARAEEGSARAHGTTAGIRSHSATEGALRDTETYSTDQGPRKVGARKELPRWIPDAKGGPVQAWYERVEQVLADPNADPDARRLAERWAALYSLWQAAWTTAQQMPEGSETRAMMEKRMADMMEKLARIEDGLRATGVGTDEANAGSTDDPLADIEGLDKDGLASRLKEIDDEIARLQSERDRLRSERMRRMQQAVRDLEALDVTEEGADEKRNEIRRRFMKEHRETDEERAVKARIEALGALRDQVEGKLK